MAKINKYWGLIALGAVTAAAAGAIAASLSRRKELENAADFDDDFEDDLKDDEDVREAKEKKESPEDFISWEASSDDEEEVADAAEEAA